MIVAHGSVTPKAFFIADGPHGEDLRTNFALTGSSGSSIAGFLRDQNLNIENFWRTVLVKEPIPSPKEDPSGEKLRMLVEKYGPLLIEEINELKPNLLIPLDELSFNYLTQLNSIRKFRGSVLPLSGPFHIEKPTKVLPILGPHPYLNQEYNLRYITRIDFSKIQKHLYEGPPPDNFYNVWVARNSGALRAFFERNYQKTLDVGGFVVFDIETYLQIPICISFCFDGFESVCVPILDKNVDRDNRTLMLGQVSKLLASPLRKVNQNIKYDWKILERWGFPVNNVSGDSMLAASVLYCEFPKNLGFLTSIYTDLPYFKDEGKQFDPDRSKRDRYYLYNAKDSLATHQIYTRQLDEVSELGLTTVLDNVLACMPLYKRMENRGIRVDEEQRRKLLLKYDSYFRRKLLSLCNLLGRQYFNPLSSKQCREVIFNELGYEKIRGVKTTETGEPSTDEQSLDALLIFGEAKRAPSTGPPVLAAIVAARKIHKVIEILELPLYPDGRFRCEYNLAGTENGRTSAGETTDQLIVLDKNRIEEVNLGYSFQNIGKHGFMIDGKTYGKDLRSMYVPSPDYSFVEIDLSGAEARVDRVLAGNFDLNIFNNPGIHRYTGSLVFGCPPGEIKKNILDENGIDRYHLSKTIRHSAERNIGAGGLSAMTTRPVQECAVLLASLHRAEPFIRDVFHKDVISALKANTHCLVAPNGRRRAFYDRPSQTQINEAISFLPQAIVSDQTKFKGIIPTFGKAAVQEYTYLLAEAHDGILTEVKKGREKEFAREYIKNVTEPIDFRTCTLSRKYVLTIPAEVSIGENWLDMREEKDI